MYKLDFNNPISVHFIGIGGISMSGLAELLHTNGFTITGSDWHESHITKHLESLGIRVVYGQHAENIPNAIDLVVYTAAVKEDNPEYQAVLAAGIPLMDRAELLGQIMLQYRNAVAVSGTHGKTTTTSMLSLMMLEGNLDPTISVGGILDAIHGNMRIGHSGNFITEACEYTNSFLKFHPTSEIILNIEAEHLDFFRDLDDIRHSFRLFAKELPKDGNLVINGEIENWREIVSDLDCNIMTYGICKEPVDLTNPPKDYTYAAANVAFDEFGHGTYDLIRNGAFVTRIRLNVVGIHNVSNSLPAIALADTFGVSMEQIQSALLQFTGTERRFEHKGTVGGVEIIDDYAHHPTEIKATLTAAQKYPHRDLWCVFQPHTYSRTKLLFPDFVEALSLADKVVLADIYAAREADPGDISSEDLKNALTERGKEAYYFKSFDEIEAFLLQNLTNGDLLITMGAGDIVSVGEALLGA